MPGSRLYIQQAAPLQCIIRPPIHRPSRYGRPGYAFQPEHRRRDTRHNQWKYPSANRRPARSKSFIGIYLPRMPAENALLRMLQAHQLVSGALP